MKQIEVFNSNKQISCPGFFSIFFANKLHEFQYLDVYLKCNVPVIPQFRLLVVMSAKRSKTFELPNKSEKMVGRSGICVCFKFE